MLSRRLISNSIPGLGQFTSKSGSHPYICRFFGSYTDAQPISSKKHAHVFSSRSRNLTSR